MPLYPGPSQPWSMQSITPIAPDATPVGNVTSGDPQVLTLSIPTGGTRVQKAIVTTAADGTVTWTYPIPLVNPPVVTAIAQGDGTSTIQCIITAVSNTSVSLKVFKQTATVNGLLGLTILVAVGTPGATSVHVYAAPNPT